MPDTVTSDIGSNAKDIAAGKNIRQNHADSSQVFNLVDPNPLYVYLSDLRIEVGFIKKSLEDVREDVRQAHAERAELIATVESIRQGIYPRWLKVIMAAMAVLAIVLAALVLATIRPF